MQDKQSVTEKSLIKEMLIRVSQRETAKRKQPKCQTETLEAKKLGAEKRCFPGSQLSGMQK